jgi:pseudouridine synthase, RluA family
LSDPILTSVRPTRTIVIDPESAGQRLDVFLARTLPDRSRAYLQKLIEDQHVLVNGHSVRVSFRVRQGESVQIDEPAPRPAEPVAQDIPLLVLYQDEDILVLDKSANLVVHPAPGSPDGTLVNALLHHCNDLSGIGGVARPGIVHRLDRDTSGVMVVTKNDRAHQALATQFSHHTIYKRYIAFALKRDGANRLADQGAFDTLFGRHPVHRKRFSSCVSQGKKAISKYKVLRRFETKTWEALKIQIEPHTGRTHQIRVHLADHGHPILGDTLYGGRSARRFPVELQPKRHALHAAVLSFIHPRTGLKVSFESPLPEDLIDLEEALEHAVTTQI